MTKATRYLSSLLSAATLLGPLMAADSVEHSIPTGPARSAPFYSIDPRVREASKLALRNFPSANPVVIGRNGTPYMVRGNFGKLRADDDARTLLPRITPIFGLAPEQLDLIGSSTDSVGGKHYAYSVTLNGLPVVGASLLLHFSADGVLSMVNGTVPDETTVLPSKAEITVERAREKLRAQYQVRRPTTTGGRLVYLLPAMDEPVRFVWELPLRFEAEQSHAPKRTTYIDANTGEFVLTNEYLFHVGDRHVWDNFATDANVFWNLGFGIVPAYAQETISESSWSFPGPAADAAFDFLGNARSYFASKFSHLGWLGYGGSLNAIVNSVYEIGVLPGPIFYSGDNATFGFAETPFGAFEGMIFLGTGAATWSPDTFGNMAFAIDVVAHEYTHGISMFRLWGPIRSTTVPWGSESAAVEEAFADIFGAMVQLRTEGMSQWVWTMGEDTGVVIRSLAEPALYGGFDHYSDYTPGAIYQNAGIGGLAYKLAVTGGLHPDPARQQFQVPAVGADTAEQVFFNALRFVIPGGANYIMTRAATEYVADQMYPSTTVRQNIGLAWEAVGVLGGWGSGGPGSAGNFRAINVSTRAFVGTGNEVMIGGFTLGGGSGTKELLLRGVGPTLGTLGVPNTLVNPFLNLGGGLVNDNWGSAPNAAAIAATAQAVGAFALNGGSLDAAMLTPFGAGSRTATVSGVGGGTGTALFEVYDPNITTAMRLLNLSTRVKARSSEPVIIGFVIAGDTAKRLLVRAVGPTLGGLGVPGALANPVLTIYSGGTQIYGNDNWSDAINAGDIATVSAQYGAFALPSGSADSAALISLPPGSYTARVTGGDGIVLAEVYDVN